MFLSQSERAGKKRESRTLDLGSAWQRVAHNTAKTATLAYDFLSNPQM